MRICSSCGEAYPDSVTVCVLDGTRLRPAGSVRRATSSDRLPMVAADRAVEPRAADERATLPRFVSIARPPVQRPETAPWPGHRERDRAADRAPDRPMPRAEGSTPPPIAEVAPAAPPAVAQPEPTTRPGTQPR